MQWGSKQGWRELKSIAFSSQQRYQFVGNYLFVVFIVNPNNSKVVNALREKMKLHIQFILRRNKLPRRKEGIYLHSCGGVGDILCDGVASPSGPQGLGSHLSVTMGSCSGRATSWLLPWCPPCRSCWGWDPRPLSLFCGEERLFGGPCKHSDGLWPSVVKPDYAELTASHPKRHSWDFAQSHANLLSITPMPWLQNHYLFSYGSKRGDTGIAESFSAMKYLN